ncbi:MAG: glutamate 5-kinase [Firmicutes bacterium]|nr:glutamate 5-kinase [Bacillota bacterium]
MKIDYGREIKRVIVKVGTSTLTHENGTINIEKMEQLVRGVADISNKGYEVILVSSGAVGAGVGKLHKKKKPSTLPEKQAVAAIGQVTLMHLYEKFFGEYNKVVGQILLTKDDLVNRKRNLNAKNTLLALLQLGAIPIINENDTVAVDEIKVGDNDRLAAYVSALIDADLLIILSDIDGLYTTNPATCKDGVLVEKVEKITAEIESYAGCEGSSFGTGGMMTKIQAAKIGTAAGVFVVIGNGNEKNLISNVVKGDFNGTVFIPHNKKIHTKKKWLLLSSKPKGSVIIDDGAQEALLKDGKSLLPIGILEVEGIFEADSVISIKNTMGKEIGRGISYYNNINILKIKGVKTKDLAKILGIEYEFDTVIHRDNMSVINM